jgi:hypothetical protein
LDADSNAYSTVYQSTFAAHASRPHVPLSAEYPDNISRTHALVHGSKPENQSFVTTVEATFVLPEVMRK